MKFIFKRMLVVACLFIAGQSVAQKQNKTKQSIYPVVGKSCPDFALRNIKYYTKKQAKVSDFRGKWLLLDFWGISCGACIASFPHLNEMKKDLGDKLEVIMVGYEDPQKKIEDKYARFRAKEDLLMPCAFDSSIIDRLEIYSFPRTFLIDPKGIVRCITTSLNAEEVKSFLDGKPKDYLTSKNDANKKIEFDRERPFLIYENGGSDTSYLFRSVISKWEPGMPFFGPDLDQYLKVGRFQALGVQLDWLYRKAYFGEDVREWDSLRYGKYYPKLILETKDSAVFQYSFRSGKNIFSYASCMPPSLATTERIQETMKRDLQNYFGFDVSIETRPCPYWKLVASEGAAEKLKSKGGPEFFDGYAKVTYKARNIPFKNVFNLIGALNDGIFIDESGITGNVDIHMDCENCVMTDVNDVKKALRENGLDLILSEKDMKVIVIRDPKSKL